MKRKLKFSHAMFWIMFSTIIISGFNYFIFTQVKKHKNRIYIDEKYNIKTIAQSDNSLDSTYLAELMELSLDKPINLFLFDENRAKEKLLSSPFIKEANVKKIKPNCIFVDYMIRKPIAFLYDFDNIAIDDEGYTFPIRPFFSDLDLCKIYLNLDESYNFEKIETKQALLALDILEKLKKCGFSDLVKIKVLDTSRSENKSYGKREIIMQIEEQIEVNSNQTKKNLIFPKILRFATNNYQEQLGNYISLREKIIKDYENQIKTFDKDLPDTITFKPKTIDLRIPKVAFIDQ